MNALNFKITADLDELVLLAFLILFLFIIISKSHIKMSTVKIAKNVDQFPNQRCSTHAHVQFKRKHLGISVTVMFLLLVHLWLLWLFENI